MINEEMEKRKIYLLNKCENLLITDKEELKQLFNLFIDGGMEFRLLKTVEMANGGVHNTYTFTLETPMIVVKL